MIKIKKNTMKKIILLLLLATSVISCSSDDDSSNKEASIIGKWNLVSDVSSNGEDTITQCQYEYFRFEFKEGDKFVGQIPNDDPDAEITQCNPVLHFSSYIIQGDKIRFPEMDLGPTDYAFIDALTETSLVLRYPVGGNLYYRTLTFKR